MYDGYNAGKEEGEDLTYLNIYLISLSGDLEDLQDAIKIPEKDRVGLKNGGRCSALVRLTPNFEELFISHVTWTGFEEMLRIFKSYEFYFHRSATDDALVPAINVTFSSSPASVYSGDDFYVMSTGKKLRRKRGNSRILTPLCLLSLFSLCLSVLPSLCGAYQVL